MQMTPGLGSMPEGRAPRDTGRGHKGQSAPLSLTERGSWKDGDLRTDKETSLQGRQEWHPRQREQPGKEVALRSRSLMLSQTGLEARGQAAGAERPAEGLWSYAQAMSCQCGSVLSRLFRR